MFSHGACSIKLHNLVTSLGYLVSNGRQVLLEGIRLDGYAIATIANWTRMDREKARR